MSSNDDPPIGCALLFGLLLLIGFAFAWLMVSLWVAFDPLSRLPGG
jgi:hypothetical protein